MANLEVLKQPPAPGRMGNEPATWLLWTIPKRPIVAHEAGQAYGVPEKSLAPLPIRILPAVFVHRHRGCRGNVVTVGEAPNGNLDNIIQLLEQLGRQACPFIAEDQGRFALKRVFV